MRDTRSVFFAAVCVLLLSAEAVAGPSHWPSFRGPRASGIGDGHNPPTAWDAKQNINIKWKTRIPGLAHSSPIVWGDRVYVTSAVSSDPDPYLRVGLYGESPDHPEEIVHQFNFHCLDKNTGKIIWEQTARSGIPQVKRHIKGTHANSTPATDGKHVVAFFGSEGLYCYDMDGKLLWKQDLGYLDAGAFDAPEIQWGFGSSPTIYKNMVIVLCDVNNQSFIAAFDIDTGKELWRSLRDEVPGWGTPTVVESGGRTQVIVNGWQHIGGYDVNTGEELWWMQGGGDIPVPTPVVAHGLVFITNAHGPMSPIYAIRLDAEGDISLDDGETSNEYVVWSRPRRGAYIPTPIVYGDYLYVGNDVGILTCYEAKTGEQVYRERIAGRRDSYSASAVAGDGRLYFTAEGGDIHVVKAGPEYELLATNSMDNPCLATPAVSDGMLIVRTSKHLYGIAGSDPVVKRDSEEATGKGTASEKVEQPAKPDKPKPVAKSGEQVGELTDPVEILRRADAACKAVEAVKYDVEVEATGALLQYVGKLEATITAQGFLDRTPERFLVEANATLPGTTQARKITGGSNGDMYYVVDHQTRTAHEDLDLRVMGSFARPIVIGMMNELLHPEPFSDEINSPTKELKGSKTVGGEECYEVYVVYPSEQSPKATWYFSKKDFLPRARYDEYTLGDGGTGLLKKTVTNL
ncbi:MAG: PQQ-binding-like beta-propeller repeat protein, partial [Planctomycetes bacterium]|nr:PQQ-binding-like beta-propeller repeat protein [Planctomycetota bacterium]